MLKRMLFGLATAAMVVMGFSVPALAKPGPQGGPPPGCEKNGHPYGPPCGPPSKCDNGDNDSDQCPPPPPPPNCHKGDNDSSNCPPSDRDHGDGDPKNSAFVTHQRSTSGNAGDIGMIASIAGVSLAGLIALRKRPATG